MKRTLTFWIGLFSLGFLLIFLANCQKEEFVAPIPIKIMVAVEGNETQSTKSSASFSKEKSTDVLLAQVFAKTGEVKENVYGTQKAPVQPKSQINDGDIIIVYGAGKTIMFDTDPLTAINWTITGPPDTTIVENWTNVEAITYKLPILGDYNVNPNLPGPYGFSWNMTVRVLGSPDELNIVDVRFVGSQWVAVDSTFRYTYRINKPLFITTETLFRITELSADASAPYLPFYDGVNITPGGDSIDISFSYPANGLTAIKVKFIAGYMNASGDTIWFNAEPTSLYKCTEPIDSDIFQATIYNGLEGTETTTFPTPTGVQPGMGDYGEDVSVVLMSLPVTGGVDLFLLSENATTFRYKELETDPWIEVALTNMGNGRYSGANLPENPTSGEHIFDYGTGTGAGFVQDPYVVMSSLYYTPYGAMVLVH